MNNRPEDEREPVQIDLYGVRLRITPESGESPTPKSWREVWSLVHEQLRGVVTDAFGLVGDTLKGARNLVRGIGAIPRAVANRVERAHQQADFTEYELRSSERQVDINGTLSDLASFLRRKQVEGVTVRLITRPEGLAICFLPPTDDTAALAVLSEAAAQLLETQTSVGLLGTYATTSSVTRPTPSALALDELLALPIERLDISVRSANALKNGRIRTLGDLVQRTEADMLSLKNFGRRNLKEIKTVLASLGLALGMRDESTQASTQEAKVPPT